MSAGDLIVGIGSPHGDDAVGWLAIDRLSQRLGRKVRAISLRQPVELADHLDGCRRLWILDGCHGSHPGTLHRLPWPDSRIELRRPQSSHGLGLDAALELVAALGRLPDQVVIFAIEASGPYPSEPVAGVSAEVETALSELERRLTDELNARPIGISR